jgi:ABC-type branched-subunit amino acid transport system ATPase component
VSLIGRNGMGKTTTVRAIMGLIRPAEGAVRFMGRAITGERPFRVARAGPRPGAGRTARLRLPHGGGEPDCHRARQ